MGLGGCEGLNKQEVRGQEQRGQGRSGEGKSGQGSGRERVTQDGVGIVIENIVVRTVVAWSCDSGGGGVVVVVVTIVVDSSLRHQQPSPRGC